MARFYFDIYNDDVTIDDEGVECINAALAHESAVRAARALACDEIKSKGRLNLGNRIVVRNSDKHEISAVLFGEAIEIIG